MEIKIVYTQFKKNFTVIVSLFDIVTVENNTTQNHLSSLVNSKCLLTDSPSLNRSSSGDWVENTRDKVRSVGVRFLDPDVGDSKDCDVAPPGLCKLDSENLDCGISTCDCDGASSCCTMYGTLDPHMIIRALRLSCAPLITHSFSS